MAPQMFGHRTVPQKKQRKNMTSGENKPPHAPNIATLHRLVIQARGIFFDDLGKPAVKH